MCLDLLGIDAMGGGVAGNLECLIEIVHGRGDSCGVWKEAIQDNVLVHHTLLPIFPLLNILSFDACQATKILYPWSI